jgi:mannan endo-1,4-beta-mannosidase
MIKSILIFLCFHAVIHLEAQRDFVITNHQNFIWKKKPYQYIGANYWYGGFLAFDSANNGKQRLQRELNALQKNGISNLRVFICAEGDSSYPYRIFPSIQVQRGNYNEEILKSFDYFIHEASKRNMKIVFVLNNNWEWSGGFGQYLEWAGRKNPILPKTNNWDWDLYCQYISQFYSCDSCIAWNEEWIRKILYRKNTISKKYYFQDPTIMTWELANEPRPMTREVVNNYKHWIQRTSQLIKSIDTNHLVTIGVEGMISTRMDSALYKEIHSYPAIDYATIHLWPKTWQWYDGESSHAIADTTLERTKNYIDQHAQFCKELGKPMVIEEFGLHRDNNIYKEYTPTINRDRYFEYIFKIGKSNHVAGYNFWGCFGLRNELLTNDFWRRGMPYSADPPQEEQGLYGVYKSDASTWKIIRRQIVQMGYR